MEVLDVVHQDAASHRHVQGTRVEFFLLVLRRALSLRPRVRHRDLHRILRRRPGRAVLFPQQQRDAACRGHVRRAADVDATRVGHHQLQPLPSAQFLQVGVRAALVGHVEEGPLRCAHAEGVKSVDVVGQKERGLPLEGDCSAQQRAEYARVLHVVQAEHEARVTEVIARLRQIQSADEAVEIFELRDAPEAPRLGYVRGLGAQALHQRVICFAGKQLVEGVALT
mmetsp:Transcript_74441/g.206739  ORF Transcript_74441/g.206739 Transcript_74441/m.206739 type:complete len:225 (+) Transcript_74441:125-799(+)